MLSFLTSRKNKIWQAAFDGDINTITRLLPLATAEDLQYMVITYSISSDLIKLLILYIHKFIYFFCYVLLILIIY